MKNSYITITDQFCGAGGSSQGARRLGQRVKGIEVKLALNHWKLAIETHQHNFENTLHDCTDISACDPKKYPSTDILITSPECTNHSLAKGKKIIKAQMDMFEKGVLDASAERSRATMWDVPRFAEYHNYNIIIVENVVDARKWIMFDAWIHAMDLLGYKHKCVYANSMFFYPTPQSRDRMYVVFWKKGNKVPDLDYRPLAHCAKCEKNINAMQRWKNQTFGKYKTQYNYCCPICGNTVTPYYYAAFNCIDWSDRGKRIGDRKKSLSENTIKRIEYGLNKYKDESFLSLYYSPGVNSSIYETFNTVTANDHHSLINPFIINDQHSTGIDFRVKSSNDIFPTVSTVPNLKVVFPFLIKEEHSRQNNIKISIESLQTQTTRQSFGLLTPPFIVEMKKQSKTREVINPLSTLTTKPYHGLITSEKWNSFLSYYYGNNQSSHISEPIGSCTTKDRHCIINYDKPNIDDCYFRMLKPQEIKLAMAFDSNYTILGSGKDQVKQCGNAVTPPVMEWLLDQTIKTLN